MMKIRVKCKMNILLSSQAVPHLPMSEQHTKALRNHKDSENHYDCVNAGYGIAQQTFRSLEELEEFEKDYIEKEKIAIRFECREVGKQI